MAKDLKLGLNTGYWAGGPPHGAAEAIAAADELGFDSIWTAEAYGSDALTPLAWWGAATSQRAPRHRDRADVGAPAHGDGDGRVTMDLLSGGRFILGLGVSGPQVVEGWYGEPFAKPLARTREYVQICRDVFARKGAGHERRAVLPAPADRGRRRRRAGQGAEADAAPGARGPADHARRRGPEERRAERRDRRRLDGALLLPAPRGALPPAAGGGLRAGPARGAPGRTSRSPPPCR